MSARAMSAKKTRGQGLALALSLPLVLGAFHQAGAEPADEPQRFKLVCGSSGSSSSTCHFGFAASKVTIEKQLSSAACIEDTTWQATGRSVTVHNGCDARFEVETDTRRPKVVILTDIGQDPDDTQSLIRALLHANDLSIEGIIPTYRPGGRLVASDLAKLVIKTYGKDVDQLRQHDIRYPDADELLARLKPGHPFNDKIGAGYDSPGSKHLVKVVDASEEPVWVLVWGGSRELAQAVYKVRNTRSDKAFHAFIDKLRVYAIAWSQYSPEPAEYLAANANDLFWISSASYDGKKNATFRGMYMLGDHSMQDRAWKKEFILSRGQLGKLYPLTTTEDGLKEGDTPSLLHVLPIGLSDPERPEEGGWGGRYEQEPAYAHITRNFFSSRDVKDWLDDQRDRRASVARWRPAFQAEFAARAAWLELDYDDANHPPIVAMDGETSRAARSGDKITLDASASVDPDDDRLSYRWWIYKEASSLSDGLEITDSDSAVATVVVPEVEKQEEVSIILEVQDDGMPALTRYQRIRLIIDP
ncbi:MAG TPA: nucleoside hydrolase-like domain-containing protein [Geminicoccus sp.]|uniref:nucleoside hydrolase-like domain-containing protein n=1 Tax=Geminicoccus sp. TaxID=2024832 RepID=UPI002E35EEF8|nr:nucleoside hydrolase-like domain-containing protein [Geminicoccus sp.]HEX2528778.1 nucleoside hydrolase-like domain-containing protein [Geminicoccus sp.]